MNGILMVRNKIARIYSEGEFLFKLAAKFIFALMTLNYLTENLGYYEVLNILSIRLFLAVVCAFIPVPFVVLLMGLVAVLHLIRLSMVIGVLAAIVFVIVYFLYVKFAPAQGIYMLAIAVLAPFNLQYAVAFVLGMFYTPVTLIPAGLTIVLIRFSGYAKAAAAAMGTDFEMEKILAGYQSIVDSMLSDRSIIVMALALAVIIVVTFVISRLPFDYSWYVAIGAAAVANLAALMIGASVFHTEVNMGGAFMGTLLGAVLAAVLQFMKCVVDYPKKEFVQFEDDDYYYYVKAIPKLGDKPVYARSEDRPKSETKSGTKKRSRKPQTSESADAPRRRTSGQESRPRDDQESAASERPQRRRSTPQAQEFDFNDVFDDYSYFDDSEGKF